MSVKAELKSSGTLITTGETRLSYCHLLEPWVSDADKAAGKAPKYSTCIIIPKTDADTLNVYKQAVANAVTKGAGKLQGATVIKKPLRDGDEKSAEGDFLYKDDDPRRGCYFFNANSNRPVSLLDQQMRVITSDNDLYSGCYARVLVNFYAYAGQQKGIAAGLNGVQKIRDGERLGTAAANAFEEFDAIEAPADVDPMS